MRNIGKAIDLIKKWEGFRSKAYKDPVGIWTIGYGTIKYPNGVRVAQGDNITEEKATAYLNAHIMREIIPVLDYKLGVPINDNQYCALVSFAYNLGMGALGKSTLLNKLNAGDSLGAGQEFKRWVKAGGQTLNGLIKRREEERALFELGLNVPTPVVGPVVVVAKHGIIKRLFDLLKLIFSMLLTKLNGIKEELVLWHTKR